MLAFRQLRSGTSLLTQIVQPMSSLAVESTAEASKLQESALHENCILVDENDKYLGQSSKRDCHRVSETGELKLHRAFSVFLFNTKGDMLVQRRSTHKVCICSASV
jgi:isopentenyl-diphosphate Delta-isomerase